MQLDIIDKFEEMYKKRSVYLKIRKKGYRLLFFVFLFLLFLSIIFQFWLISYVIIFNVFLPIFLIGALIYLYYDISKILFKEFRFARLSTMRDRIFKLDIKNVDKILSSLNSNNNESITILTDYYNVQKNKKKLDILSFLLGTSVALALDIGHAFIDGKIKNPNYSVLITAVIAGISGVFIIRSLYKNIRDICHVYKKEPIDDQQLRYILIHLNLNKAKRIQNN